MYKGLIFQFKSWWPTALQHRLFKIFAWNKIFSNYYLLAHIIICPEVLLGFKIHLSDLKHFIIEILELNN